VLLEDDAASLALTAVEILPAAPRRPVRPPPDGYAAVHIASNAPHLAAAAVRASDISIYLSPDLPIYPPTHLSLSLYLSIAEKLLSENFTCLSPYLPIYLAIHLPTYIFSLSIYSREAAP